MRKKRIVIGVVGEKSVAVGEHHPRAILSDDEVELVRTLHEEGEMKVSELAKSFGVSRSCVYSIINFQRRACTPDKYKTIEVFIDDDGNIFKLTEL